MKMLRCYVPAEGPTGSYAGIFDRTKEAALYAAECTAGVERAEGVAGTGVVFDVPMERATDFISIVLECCGFVYFTDEHKPQWAAALVHVLDNLRIGPKSAAEGVSVERMRHLRATLGGHFGAKLETYLMKSDYENFMEAYSYSAGEYRKGLLAALVRCNEWGPVKDPTAHFETFHYRWAEGKPNWTGFILPGIIAITLSIPGVLEWMEERQKVVNTIPLSPPPNPALNAGG